MTIYERIEAGLASTQEGNTPLYTSNPPAMTADRIITASF